MKQQSFLVALAILAGALLGGAITILALHKPVKPINPCEYQFIVTDDSVTVYDGIDTIGTIKLEGQLDSLITLDNQ